MGNRERVEKRIQHEYDRLTADLNNHIEHGFEQMQQNPSFNNYIKAILKRVQENKPDKIVLEWCTPYPPSVSVLGLQASDFGLPRCFEKELDFAIFSYGLATTIQACRIDICVKGNRIRLDSVEEYTHNYQLNSIADFLDWIKRKFSYNTTISDRKYGYSLTPGRIVYSITEDKFFGGRYCYGAVLEYDQGSFDTSNIQSITLFRTKPPEAPKTTEKSTSWY